MYVHDIWFVTLFCESVRCQFYCFCCVAVLQKYIEEVKSKSSRRSNLSEMTPKAMVNNNLKFNEALLKECKTKVCLC